MRRRRAWIAGWIFAVVLLGLAPLAGRWEQRHWVRAQIRGMQRVRAEVGPLDSPSLIGYRVLPTFDCLVYRRRIALYALELCVDGAGAVVEAIDRYTDPRGYYSLRSDSAAATARLNLGEVQRLLRKMHAHEDFPTP